ncbi:hypothetical protein K2Z84_19290, partial [Candidatus Binatia bacterium]|nr:hypothetical protein [Candidatus Binatia bacterium]
MRPLRIFGAYLLLFALLAAPWLAAAGSALPLSSAYAHDDTQLLTWIPWWVSHALLHHPQALFDAPINYPAPAQLTGSEHFAGIQPLFLPVWLLTDNPVLALNAVLFLLSYPLAALAMNRLLAAYGVSAGVARVSGLVYALGALQVPANVHLLHTLALYPPLAALALRALRERPDRKHAIGLGTVLVLGFFTAYYTTALLLVMLLVCGVAELRRPLPERRRFATTAALTVAVALALLAIASRPYLARGALLAADGDIAQARSISGLYLVYVVLSAGTLFGVAPLLLGAAGIAALCERRVRGLAGVGLVLVGTSLALIVGGAFALHKLPPTPLGALLQAPFAFFRVSVRWTAITGVGIALLAAALLEWARLRLPARATDALLVAVAGAVLLERGSLLYRQAVDVPRALTSDAPVYRALAEVVRRDGAGPLLEMPISSFGHSTQPDAMLGAITHQQPLIVGHTGYQPPHRARLDETIARLPAEDALQDLVDMTHLRWIVAGGAARKEEKNT